jgi:zinc resistance-associated protein
VKGGEDMKKATVIGLAVLTIGLLLTGVVYARWDDHGMGHGMGYGTTTDIESLKKFQKETVNLREEIMTKRFEIRSEYGKEKPDKKHIADLKKEIIDLQTKVQEIAEKYGIEKPMGHGMKGKGMMGTGRDCPC